MKRLIQQLKRFGDDERGVSLVVGFVLIFALIMIVFTIYQADVVPAQNEQVEFEHSQTVEGQMEQLSAAIVNTAGSGANTSVSQRTSIQTGVQYPSRAFAINPGNPVGALEATDPQPVVISGVDTKSGGEVGLNTSFINYQPNYNRLSEETEISLEYSMVLKDYSGSDNVFPVTTQGGARRTGGEPLSGEQRHQRPGDVDGRHDRIDPSLDDQRFVRRGNADAPDDTPQITVAGSHRQEGLCHVRVVSGQLAGHQ